MTNEEKAKELAKQLLADYQNQQPLIDVLLQMAQWKEHQLKKVCKKCEQHIIDSGKAGCAFRSLGNEYCWQD